MRRKCGRECATTNKNPTQRCGEKKYRASGISFHYFALRAGILVDCLRVRQLPCKGDAGNVTLLVCPHFVQARAARAPIFFRIMFRLFSLPSFNPQHFTTFPFWCERQRAVVYSAVCILAFQALFSCKGTWFLNLALHKHKPVATQA